MDLFLLIVAIAVIGYATLSAWLPRTIISSPIFFVASGMLAAAVFGETDQREQLEVLAELTLVVLLFTDASRIDARTLMGELTFPVRLLGIGLPLTVLLGAAVAKLVLPEFTFSEAALVAAMLAPTDAALGQAVVSSKQVPLRIRQALNVESGLNDGVVVPVVLLFAAMVTTAESNESTNWFVFWGKQVTLGPIAGVFTTWVGIKMLELAADRQMVTAQYKKLSGIALAVLAWSAANAIGGNGFIAAFAGGMTIGCTAHRLRPAIQEFGETEGQLLSILAFSLFGTLALPAIADAAPRDWLYALLSLTVIRMLPVAIAMIGTRTHWATVLFVGWFGPRGLASLIFALIITSEYEFAHRDHVFEVTIITTLLSVILHGVSAVPGAAAYGRFMKSLPEESCEHEDVATHPLRYESTT